LKPNATESSPRSICHRIDATDRRRSRSFRPVIDIQISVRRCPSTLRAAAREPGYSPGRTPTTIRVRSIVRHVAAYASRPSSRRAATKTAHRFAFLRPPPAARCEPLAPARHDIAAASLLTEAYAIAKTAFVERVLALALDTLPRS
jgi:hypothetical protein